MEIRLMNLRILLVIVCLLGTVLGCGVSKKLLSGSDESSGSNTSVPSASPNSETTESTSPEALKQQKDLLAFASGTTFAKMPQEHSPGSSNWGALGLIDEIPGRGWAMDGGGESVNETMVLEMPERSLLKTFVFDNGSAEEKTSAKDIVVEISDSSATSGFVEVLATKLADNIDGQSFELEKPIAGRWVRLTVQSNYGSEQWTEIMEFRGYGEQLTTTAPSNSISGTYEMSSFGPFHIKQDGTAVSGCYEYAEGLFSGGIENRVIRFNWSEADSEGKRKGGPAVMVFSADGKTITGAWAGDDFDTNGFAGQWNGKKISDAVGNCPHAPDLDKKNAAKDTIGSDLKEKGRATVYGINFDFNSDVIKAESKPTLDQIISILIDNKDWKMTVEGHTDNIGGQSFNQTLSEKRAAAVVKYLTDAGIDATRLNSAGFGFSKPTADNDTEFGRAQNRRVELVKN
jgi:outer membrane protein OmpA-like peptidoglycan-associated protein